MLEDPNIVRTGLVAATVVGVVTRKGKKRDERRRAVVFQISLLFFQDSFFFSQPRPLSSLSLSPSLFSLLIGRHGLDGRLRLRPEHRLDVPRAAARDKVEVALALRRDAPALLRAVGRLFDDADRLELLEDVADEAAGGEGVPLRGAAAGRVAAAVGAAERADAEALFFLQF